MKRSLRERFEEKILKTTDCWFWIGARTHAGYGLISGAGASRLLTHRVSWELTNQQRIPDGLSVCHSCDNPHCVNPDHLFLGTHRENMQDAGRKGRMGKPKNRPRAKQILRMLGEGQKPYLIARHFGMSEQAICDLRKGRTWRDLPGQRSEKRESARGAAAGNAKLTEAQAREAIARLSSGETRRTVADALGVTWYAINDLRRGRTWKHLGGP